MANKELLSQYVVLRQRLEKLYRQSETVEAELREVERELKLADIQLPDVSDLLPETAIIDDRIFERRASQPR